MIELMKEKGYDFLTDVPLSYIFGVFGKKLLVKMKNEADEEYVRTRTFNFCVNLMEQDRQNTYELFTSKYYIENLITTIHYDLE